MGFVGRPLWQALRAGPGRGPGPIHTVQGGSKAASSCETTAKHWGRVGVNMGRP